MIMSVRTALTTVSAVVVLGSVLVGCSGDEDGVENGDGPSSPGPVATPVDRTPSPLPSLEKEKGVAKDVKIATCDLEAGDVKAAGTVVNTSKKKADFAITIIWLPNNSSDPVALASTTVESLGAAETADWSIATSLPIKADRCVLNARRGSLE